MSLPFAQSDSHVPLFPSARTKKKLRYDGVGDSPMAVTGSIGDSWPPTHRAHPLSLWLCAARAGATGPVVIWANMFLKSQAIFLPTQPKP